MVESRVFYRGRPKLVPLTPLGAASAMVNGELFRLGNGPVAVRIVAVTMDGVAVAETGRNDDCTSRRPLDSVLSFRDALDRFGVGFKSYA